jgi:hypothetical protein
VESLFGEKKRKGRKEMEEKNNTTIFFGIR